MKALLYSLLAIIVLGLCGVCVVQWQREFLLNAKIKELTDQLIAENKLRIEFEEKAFRFEQEIARITQLRNETEAALLEATEQVKLLTEDQTARGYSIAVLMNEAMSTAHELAAYKQLAEKGGDALKDRNTEVSEQNSAIEKANASLRQLVSERDDLINKLNARTREFNELVEKYNKLAKER